MLYSHNGKYPKEIPYRITLSNGYTRTDPSTFTIDELLDAGYILVENPPLYSYPNKLIWNGTNWEIVNLTDEEIYKSWDDVRTIRNKLLQESDIFIIISYENNIQVSKEIKDYRQALRDITLQSDPNNISWPTKPTQI